MALKKILSFGFLLFGVLFFYPHDVLAKRVLPTAGSAKTTAKTTTKGVTAKVKFRSDRRAIVVTLSNLSIATKVDYVLSYTSKSVAQGASGTITSGAEDPLTREILFGTCSHGVCRYDSQITNAKFTVTTTLKNGRKVSKSFRLKV